MQKLDSSPLPPTHPTAGPLAPEAVDAYFQHTTGPTPVEPTIASTSNLPKLNYQVTNENGQVVVTSQRDAFTVQESAQRLPTEYGLDSLRYSVSRRSPTEFETLHCNLEPIPDGLLLQGECVRNMSGGHTRNFSFSLTLQSAPRNEVAATVPSPPNLTGSVVSLFSDSGYEALLGYLQGLRQNLPCQKYEVQTFENGKPILQLNATYCDPYSAVNFFVKRGEYTSDPDLVRDVIDELLHRNSEQWNNCGPSSVSLYSQTPMGENQIVEAKQEKLALYTVNNPSNSYTRVELNFNQAHLVNPFGTMLVGIRILHPSQFFNFCYANETICKGPEALIDELSEVLRALHGQSPYDAFPNSAGIQLAKKYFEVQPDNICTGINDLWHAALHFLSFR